MNTKGFSITVIDILISNPFNLDLLRACSKVGFLVVLLYPQKLTNVKHVVYNASMSNEMTWEEAQAVIRKKAKEKPRGWQSIFAGKIGVKRQFINDIVKGKRLIPEKYIDSFLQEFSLQIVEDK